MKKFKTIDDVAIRVSGEKNKKIEAIKELDEVEQFAGVEKLSVWKKKKSLMMLLYFQKKSELRQAYVNVFFFILLFLPIK